MTMQIINEIKLVPVKEIRPYHRNVRIHERTVEQLVEVIPHVGFNVPLVLTRANVIVKGHARWKAAIQLGLERVPCVYTDADEEVIKLDRLTDNKISELSAWDNDLLPSELASLSLDFEFNLEALGFNISLPPGAETGPQEPGPGDQPFITEEDIRRTAPANIDTELDQAANEGAIDTSPVELGFVVDRSESMGHLRTELINAFNAVLAEQAAPNVRASLALFGSEVDIIADRIPVSAIRPLNQQSYQPKGFTALLDGIGTMIFLVDRQATAARKLVAIFTDGHENCSTSFDLEQIIHAIATRQEEGWQFIFVTPRRGIAYGQGLGIPLEHIVEFDASAEGLKSIMGRLSKTVKAYRLGDEEYAQHLQLEE